MDYSQFKWRNEKFLIADDDHYSHLLLDKMIQRTGADVVHVYNGIQAVEYLMKDDKITIGIIDLKMPGLSGYEVVEKTKPFREDVTFFAYTADAINLDQRHCENLGFAKCLIKPIIPIKLFEIIDEMILIK